MGRIWPLVAMVAGVRGAGEFAIEAPRGNRLPEQGSSEEEVSDSRAGSMKMRGTKLRSA